MPRKSNTEALFSVCFVNTDGEVRGMSKKLHYIFLDLARVSNKKKEESWYCIRNVIDDMYEVSMMTVGLSSRNYG